jgi:serine/threonine protein kinase
MEARAIEILKKLYGQRACASAFPATLTQELLSFVGCEIFAYRKSLRQTCWNGIAGLGGQGVVFKADYNALNSVVAVKFGWTHVPSTGSKFVKILAGDFRSNFETAESIPDQRFIESAKLQKTLAEEFMNKGDFIIPSVYAFSTKPVPHLIMKWLEGVGLLDIVRDRGSIKYALQVFRKVCCFVHEMHLRKYVYRDIKPSNFRIGGTGDQLIVYDFGLLKPFDRNLTAEGVSLGTAPFASPAVLNGAQAQMSDEIHSLGVLMAALVLGEDLEREQSISIGSSLGSVKDYLEGLKSRLPTFLHEIFDRATSLVGSYYAIVPDLLEDLDTVCQKQGLGLLELKNDYSMKASEVDEKASTVICSIQQQGHIVEPVQGDYKAGIQKKKNAWEGVFEENSVQRLGVNRVKANLEREMNSIVKDIECYNPKSSLCRACKDKRMSFCKRHVVAILAILVEAFDKE